MARGRKGGPTRMDLRREAEAVEARDREATTSEVVEDEEVEEEEVEEVDAEEADDDGDEAPKAKAKAKVKKKAEPKAKKPTVKRVRTPKEVRMKALWVVFDNSSKRVKEFPFSQKAAAETLLAEKIEEKKTTFYLQLVKEPLES